MSDGDTGTCKLLVVENIKQVTIVLLWQGHIINWCQWEKQPFIFNTILDKA